MSARIEVMLSIWGKWAIRSASKSLGYPTASAGFADYMAPRGETYAESRLPLGVSEPDILRIDGAINRLPLILRIVVIHIYVTRQSGRAIAAELGISVQSLGKYKEEAHRLLGIDIENQCEQNPLNPASFGFCAPNKPAKA